MDNTRLSTGEAGLINWEATLQYSKLARDKAKSSIGAAVRLARENPSSVVQNTYLLSGNVRGEEVYQDGNGLKLVVLSGSVHLLVEDPETLQQHARILKTRDQVTIPGGVAYLIKSDQRDGARLLLAAPRNATPVPYDISDKCFRETPAQAEARRQEEARIAYNDYLGI